MEQFLQVETLVIELLLVVSIVAIAVRRLRIPYTVALVVVGLLITLQQPIEVNLTPELILALFVPPLVFEAAFHLSLADLQRNMVGLLIFAVPGVILTTLIVGLVVSEGAAISLPLALIFGALIAATDPISVVALFRVLGAPKRLSVLVEGESLFNDGTAIVVFNIMLAFALTGQFSLLQGVTDFVRVAAGGALIGLVLGWIVNRFAEPIPRSWQHVMGWGGLRGAISLALVLSLPTALGAGQELLRVMAFGVVLFTLLVQSTTMGPLLRWLKISVRSGAQVEYEMRHARLVALRAARTHLDNLHRQGILSTHSHEILKPGLDDRIAFTTKSVREVLQSEPGLEAEELDTARRELLRAQRSAILGLRRDGVISEETFEKLVAEVDAELLSEPDPDNYAVQTGGSVSTSPRKE